MKKLQLVANGEFKILNQVLPQLHKGESIIKLSHVGICSSDINRAFRNGAYSYPLVMGHEAMGYVYDAKGEFAPGDKVVIFPLKPCFKCGSCKKGNFQTCSDYSYYGSREDGAYQEYLTVKDWNLIKISKAIKDSDAALIEPTSVMVHVKNKLQELLDMNNGLIKSEGAIIGGGFLAMILSKILLMSGIPNHEIFERNEFKVSFAKSHGINAFNSKKIDSKEFSKSYDWVIDCSGDPNSFKRSINISKPNAKVIWMSNIYDDLKLSSNDISQIIRKELIISGSWNSTYDPHTLSDWKEAIGFIEKGFSPSDFVTHYVNLEEVPGILNRMYKHKSRKKKFRSVKAMLKL